METLISCHNMLIMNIVNFRIYNVSSLKSTFFTYSVLSMLRRVPFLEYSSNRKKQTTIFSKL